jgi:hypothetical protein
MDFSDWLREQAHRDDAVGDLSRDFIASGDSCLGEQGLGSAASCAYERALTEYAAVSVFS